MAAEEGENGAGLSKAVTVDDILEESMGLASENFDPMRIIYAPNLETANQNVEVYESVSQFIEDVDLEMEDETPHDGGNGVVSVCPQESLPATSKKPENLPAHQGQDFTMHTPTTDCSDKHTDIDTAAEHVKQSEINKYKAVQPFEFGSENESTVISDNKLGQSKMSIGKCGRRQPRKTVLTQMESGFKEGPLSILRRSVQEKIKVRVVTRSVRNIRGISTGYVVAFDKHMNLAMMDVDEVYRKPFGKHQRKRKKPKDRAATKAESAEVSEDVEVLYPNTPWQRVDRQTGENKTAADTVTKHACASDSDEGGDAELGCPSADGIGNLPSQFSGMHVFDDSETTRLLGVKTKKVLVRHQNQVLLRGDHVVAVALVEPDF